MRARIADDLVPDVGVAEDQVHDALRNAGRQDALQKSNRDHRRGWGGLPDDGISARQRCRQILARNAHRIVPGSQHRDHAMRLPESDDPLVWIH